MELKQKVTGKKHILIVDDDEQILIVWRGALQVYADAVDIAVAGDGLSALQLFQEHNFDLLVTDIRMPVMDGYELTRSVRQVNQNLAIIWITAMTNHECGFIENQLNVMQCLLKPLSIAQIRQVVADALHLPYDASLNVLPQSACCRPTAG